MKIVSCKVETYFLFSIYFILNTDFYRNKSTSLCFLQSVFIVDVPVAFLVFMHEIQISDEHKNIYFNIMDILSTAVYCIYFFVDDKISCADFEV